MVRAVQKTDEVDTTPVVVHYVRRVTSMMDATVGAVAGVVEHTGNPSCPANKNGSPMVPHRSPRGGAQAHRVDSIDDSEAWSAMMARPPPF